MGTNLGYENEFKQSKNNINEVGNINESRGFFSFNKIISVKLIQIIYLIGFVIINLIAILFLVNYFLPYFFLFYETSILLSISIFLIGNLFWRLICEGWILFFKMYEINYKILNEIQKIKYNNFS